MHKVALSLLFALGVLPPAVGGCLSSDYPRGVTRKVVMLSSAPKAPFLYVRTFDYHYIVVYEPDAFVKMLRSQSEARTKRLLERIESVLPLRISYDLSVFLFTDPSLFMPIQEATALGLERGVAAIEHLPTGEFESRVDIEVDNSSEAYSLSFRAVTGQLLALDRRCIAN